MGVFFFAENMRAATIAEPSSSILEADSRDLPPSTTPSTHVPPVSEGHSPKNSSPSEVEDMTAVLGSKLTLEDTAAIVDIPCEERELTDLQELLGVCGQEVRIRWLNL